MGPEQFPQYTINLRQIRCLGFLCHSIVTSILQQYGPPKQKFILVLNGPLANDLYKNFISYLEQRRYQDIDYHFAGRELPLAAIFDKVMGVEADVIYINKERYQKTDGPYSKRSGERSTQNSHLQLLKIN